MKIKYTKHQIVLKLAAAAMLLALWGYVLVSWEQIPEKIPAHYGLGGVVDRWGDKGGILALPIVGTVLYAVLTVVTQFTSVWNVPVRDTQENRQYAYPRIRTMLIILKMELLALFFYMTYTAIHTQTLGVWFVPVTLVLVLGTVLDFLIGISRKCER